MADVDRGTGTGSAKRRLERELRSWWRHERMSIAAAQAEALHHSSGPPKYDTRVVEVAQHGAVCGQSAAARANEAAGRVNFTFDDEDVPAAGERPGDVWAFFCLCAARTWKLGHHFSELTYLAVRMMDVFLWRILPHFSDSVQRVSCTGVPVLPPNLISDLGLHALRL